MKIRRVAAATSLVILLAACSDGGGSRSPSSSPPATGSGSDLDAVPVIDSLQARGESVYGRAEFDSAQAFFRSALEHSRASNDSTRIAHALTWLAQTAYRLSDYPEARSLGEESLALKLRIGREDQLFASYNILGLVAYDESRLSDALELSERAIAVAPAAGDSSLAKGHGNLARVHVTMGDYEAARLALLEARRLGRVIGDPRTEGRVLINLAMLSQEEGATLAAIDHLEQAEPLLAAANDPLGEQFRIGQLGAAYAQTGDLGKAFTAVVGALQQSRARGVRYDEASNLEILAGLHAEAGDFDQALRLYSEAREIDRELDLNDELAMNLLATAEIHAELGNNALARQSAGEALRIHREIGARMREVEDLVTLADLSHAAGLGEEALARLAEASRLAGELGTRSGHHEVALARARIAERANDSPGVLEALAPLVQDPTVRTSTRDWEVHGLRARAFAELGLTDSAVVAGGLAIAAVERVRGGFASAVLRSGYLYGREAVFADLATVLLERGDVDEAFAVADAARGRGLVERLATMRLEAIDEGDPTRELATGERVLWRIQELNRRLWELDEIPVDDRSGPEEREAETLHAALETARSEYEAALIRATEARAGDSDGLAVLGVKRPEPARIQNALAADEALLEYLLTPVEVLVFVARRDTIVAIRSRISRDSLVSRVQIARRLLGQPALAPAGGDGVLVGLHDVLISPAEANGVLDGVRRLMVIPHAELTYLPFGALRDGPGGRYLAERFVVTHLPSGSTLPALRREGGPRGDANRASAFAPYPAGLPATVAELDAIERTVERTRLHIGSRATERQLRASLAEASIVHAATHGVLNARNPMFSRIELSPGGGNQEAARSGAIEPDPRDDGRLEVHELLGMRIKTGLVFLSGCETGVSAAWATGFHGGEEYVTLAQAFLHAGARDVVATLWRVDDEGAAAFAEAFYRWLAHGSPSEALARAQRAMIRHPEFGAPYYWAAYRLTGGG